jgi:hypothetical protein
MFVSVGRAAFEALSLEQGVLEAAMACVFFQAQRFTPHR